MSAVADALDGIRIFELREDPERWEAAVRSELAAARHDPLARAVLDSIFITEEPQRGFDLYLRSACFQTLLSVMATLRIPKSARIIEIGGGPGWLAWALRESGYQNVDLLEPNGRLHTGTASLQRVRGGDRVNVWNSLEDWYANAGTYDLVLTHNCVHHFQGLSIAAAAIRQHLSTDGRWLMVREQFADNAQELGALLRGHPFCQKYGIFEFGYPAWFYVDALEFVGYRLEAVVPVGFEGNVLMTSTPAQLPHVERALSRATGALLKWRPSWTERAYRAEMLMMRLTGKRVGRFTRPQVLLFRRVPVPAQG